MIVNKVKKTCQTLRASKFVILIPILCKYSADIAYCVIKGYILWLQLVSDYQPCGELSAHAEAEKTLSQDKNQRR